MQIGPVYAVISVVEANMVIRRHLGRPAFHVFIRHRRQRHELPALLIPVVAAVVRLLGERGVIKLVQVLPKVTVELLQTEVVHFLHVVEETLFQNANSILYRALVLGLLYFGRQDDRVVVFSPFSVILVQFWGNPVSVCNDSLLAIVADDQRRYTTKIRQSIVVYSDPLRFLGGEHSFCVNVLGIRKNSYEDNDLQNLTGEWIHHAEGLSGEVHFHLLTNDGVEVQRLFVFLTPLGIVFAKLPI